MSVAKLLASLEEEGRIGPFSALRKMRIILHLGDEGPKHVGEIARFLDVPHQQVSRSALKHMLDTGLIEHVDADEWHDEAYAPIRLTPSGRAYYRKISALETA